MRDMVDGDVTMLVPGFATIVSRPATAYLSLITFGRMDRASDRVKQGSLAVAGFASACHQAHTISGLPSALRDHPQMGSLVSHRQQGRKNANYANWPKRKRGVP